MSILNKLRRCYSRRNSLRAKAKSLASKACDIQTSAILSENPLIDSGEYSRKSSYDRCISRISKIYSAGYISMQELESVIKERYSFAARELYLAHKDYTPTKEKSGGNYHFNPPLEKDVRLEEDSYLDEPQRYLFAYGLSTGIISLNEMQAMNFFAHSHNEEQEFLKTFFLKHSIKDYVSDTMNQILERTDNTAKKSFTPILENKKL